MKLNKLAASTIASILLLGSVGQLAANAQLVHDPDATHPATETLLLSGNFGGGTRGLVKIVDRGGKRYLEFGKGFSVQSGNSRLQVVFRSSIQDNSNHSQAKSYLVLANLKSYNGAQTYEIPAHFDLKRFKTVAIFSPRPDTTFGYAQLYDI